MSKSAQEITMTFGRGMLGFLKNFVELDCSCFHHLEVQKY
jgi:hypothetical protein